jgi:membrane dipeptidase
VADLDSGDIRGELPTGLPRLEAGGVRGQFWPVWVDSILEGAEQVTATLGQIDFVHRLVEAHPHALRLARTADDVRRATTEGRIASLMGVEGGADRLVRRRAARVRPSQRAIRDAHLEPHHRVGRLRHGGLSPMDRELVREMNRVGMLVYIFHVAASTMRAALQVSSRPVMASHLSALALCDQHHACQCH